MAAADYVEKKALTAMDSNLLQEGKEEWKTVITGKIYSTQSEISSISRLISFCIVSGDKTLFSRLHSGLETGLPTEAIDWKRSFGRSTKTVSLEAKFIHFTPERIAKYSANYKKLIGYPVLHTFWIECPVIIKFSNQILFNVNHMGFFYLHN